MWLPVMCPLMGTWPATQVCALTGNRTSDPLLHRPALNPLSCTGQAKVFFLSGGHGLNVDETESV